VQTSNSDGRGIQGSLTFPHLAAALFWAQDEFQAKEVAP
jgi:hypothetical protein